MRIKLAAVGTVLLFLVCGCSIPSDYYTAPTVQPELSGDVSAATPTKSTEIPKNGLLTENLSAHTIDSPEVTEALTSAFTDFSVGLFQRCLEPGVNRVFSPVAAYTALGMAAVGSDGDTLTQFEKVIGGGSPLNDTLKAYHKALDLISRELGATKVRMANSLWLDTKSMEPKKAYLQDNVDWFGSEVYSENLGEGATLEKIGAWARERTEGRIGASVAEIPPDTAMLLVSAVCFDGAWKVPFEEPADGRFKAPGGGVDATFISATGSFEMVESGELKGVLLPFDDDAHGFMALIPSKSKTLEEAVGKMTGATLSALMESRVSAPVKVTLPVFHTASDYFLRKAVIDMGLTKPFEAGVANLSRLAVAADSPLCIGDLFQTACISVDRYGTRADAEPGTLMSVTDVQADHALLFDRPFLYAVVELETGFPLLIGTLNSPVS